MIKNSKETINVAYASDRNYFLYSMVSICSLLDNNQENNICIYYLDCGLTTENVSRLQKTVDSYHQQLVIVDYQSIVSPLPYDVHKNPMNARLFLVNIPGIDRVIYLDCDTIVLGDLQEYWNISDKDIIPRDNAPKYIFGVNDILTMKQRKQLGFDDNEIYINSGSLLLDIDKLRCNFLNDVNEYISNMGGIFHC